MSKESIQADVANNSKRTFDEAIGSDDKMKVQRMKLEYFDIRGIAELSRILLKIAGVDFDDVRYPAAFPNGKLEAPEFHEKRMEGAFDANMSRVPCLTTAEGNVIGQSGAIQRYIARKYGLMGKTEEDAAIIDCICENIGDIKSDFRKVSGDTDEKAIAEWKSSTLGDWLQKLEKSLHSHSLDCAVGGETSLADVLIWNLLNNELKHDSVDSALHPKVHAIEKKISSNAALKKWLQERPDTEY